MHNREEDVRDLRSQYERVQRGFKTHLKGLQKKLKEQKKRYVDLQKRRRILDDMYKVGNLSATTLNLSTVSPKIPTICVLDLSLVVSPSAFTVTNQM